MAASHLLIALLLLLPGLSSDGHCLTAAAAAARNRKLLVPRGIQESVAAAPCASEGNCPASSARAPAPRGCQFSDKCPDGVPSPAEAGGPPADTCPDGVPCPAQGGGPPPDTSPDGVSCPARAGCPSKRGCHSPAVAQATHDSSCPKKPLGKESLVDLEVLLPQYSFYDELDPKIWANDGTKRKSKFMEITKTYSESREDTEDVTKDAQSQMAGDDDSPRALDSSKRENVEGTCCRGAHPHCSEDVCSRRHQRENYPFLQKVQATEEPLEKCVCDGQQKQQDAPNLAESDDAPRAVPGKCAGETTPLTDTPRRKKCGKPDASKCPSGTQQQQQDVCKGADKSPIQSETTQQMQTTVSESCPLSKPDTAKCFSGTQQQQQDVCKRADKPMIQSETTRQMQTTIPKTREEENIRKDKNIGEKDNEATKDAGELLETIHETVIEYVDDAVSKAKEVIEKAEDVVQSIQEATQQTVKPKTDDDSFLKDVQETVYEYVEDAVSKTETVLRTAEDTVETIQKTMYTAADEAMQAMKNMTEATSQVPRSGRCVCPPGVEVPQPPADASGNTTYCPPPCVLALRRGSAREIRESKYPYENRFQQVRSTSKERQELEEELKDAIVDKIMKKGLEGREMHQTGFDKSMERKDLKDLVYDQTMGKKRMKRTAFDKSMERKDLGKELQQTVLDKSAKRMEMRNVVREASDRALQNSERSNRTK